MGRRLATARQAQSSRRPATGRGRPVQGRRREATGQGERPRDGEPPTRHAAQPATRDRRIHTGAARGRWGKEGSRGRRHGRRRVGWGGGGARSTPSPANPTSRDVAGRRPGREEGRTTHTAREETTPPGGGRGGGRPRPRGRGRMEGAEGWGAGGVRAGRGGAGRQLRRAAFPKPEPPPQSSAHRPPQQTLLAQLLTPKHHRGRPPTVDPTTRGGAPSRRGSLPLPPFFPSHPAPHGWRRGSRAGRGEATDTALGTDHVNDPSAGSPTETLLRLLLPLDSQVRPSSQRSARAVGRPRRGRSEGLTKPSNR